MPPGALDADSASGTGLRQWQRLSSSDVGAVCRPMSLHELPRFSRSGSTNPVIFGYSSSRTALAPSLCFCRPGVSPPFLCALAALPVASHKLDTASICRGHLLVCAAQSTRLARTPGWTASSFHHTHLDHAVADFPPVERVRVFKFHSARNSSATLRETPCVSLPLVKSAITFSSPSIARQPEGHRRQI